MDGVCSEAGLGIVKLEGFGGFRHYIASTGSRVGMKNGCFRVKIWLKNVNEELSTC